MTNYKRSLVKIRNAKSWFSKIFNKSNEIPETEKKILHIIKHIINDDDSHILIAPTTNTYYAKASKQNVLVILDATGNCNILNSVCNYYVTLSHNTMDEITAAFRQKFESNAEAFKTEYLKSRDENLQNIINTL
jgi:DeoR/GlpR family transcriptional regulator of sugar metabolism